METKKTRSASLENKRTLFFQIGMIIALALMLVAFEWSTRENDKYAFLETGENVFDEIIIPNTTMPEMKEPPKPEVFLFDIVPDNDPELDDDPIFTGVETSENSVIDMHKWTQPPEENTDTGSEIFYVVEDMPKFNGGDIKEFWKYIQEHVTYSEKAKELGLQGRIMVNFVVDQKGDIVNIILTRKIDPLLDNEVIRTLNEAPLWEPGKQRGRPVKVAFSMPVIFRLTER
jgi:protein TonB